MEGSRVGERYRGRSKVLERCSRCTCMFPALRDSWHTRGGTRAPEGHRDE